MKLYITTTAINDNGHMTRHGVRKNSHIWKKLLLNKCIKHARMIPNVRIMGIISPESLANKDSFLGIPVQKVKTRVKPGELNYEQCSIETRKLANFANFKMGLKDGEVLELDHPEKSSKKLFGNSEHQILFCKMTVKTPCIIIDGDVILHSIGNVELYPDETFKIGSNFVYLNDEYDKNWILQENRVSRFAVTKSNLRCKFDHFNDEFMNQRFEKYGPDIEKLLDI